MPGRGVQRGVAPLPQGLWKSPYWATHFQAAIDSVCAVVYPDGMGHKVVAHARKIKTTVGLANVAAHNSRRGVYDGRGAIIEPKPDWISRLDRAHLNEGDELPAEVILKRYRDRIKAAEATNLAEGQRWRKPQKNAAAAIEVVVSASPEWFDQRNEADAAAYMVACRQYLARRFGEANIIHWATHYDEKTPHMHLLLTPIVHTEDGLKFSSSEMLGGRQGLRRLQDDLAAIGAAWGLERGVEGSTARHTNQAEWLAEQRRLIEQAKEKAKAREARLVARELELDKMEAALKSDKQALEALRSALAGVNQRYIDASKLNQETKALLNSTDPKVRGFTSILARGFASIPASRRDEYIDRLKAVVNEFVAGKSNDKTNSRDVDRGR